MVRRVVAKKNLRLLVKNIANGFLPPVLNEFLLWLNRKLEGDWLNRWKITPIDTGLHYLENFKNCGAKKYWLQLKGEVRAGIIINDKIDFSIACKSSNYEYLQIGFGARKSRSVNAIKIFLDDVLCGHIEDLSDDAWHDLRLKLDIAKSGFNLRIEQLGIKKLYFSHPILIRKKELDRSTTPGRPKNIICLIADSINLKYFKLFGNKITPNLHDFFEKGTSCNQAFTQADWTLPAFSSMLTGLYVSRHGVCHPGPNDFPLRSEVLTLPELMLRQGYRTYGQSSHNRFNPAYGQAKGFERFIYKPFSDEFSYTAMQDAIFHLDTHKSESNFIFMHVFDVHPPYKPSSYLKENLMKPFRDDCLFQKVKGEKYDSHLDNMEDEMQAKLKEFDVTISNLFSYLEKNNMVDDTLIVFTADHGVCYRGKGKPRLIDERIHVPLLVRGPNIPKGKENSFVECSVDLMPSILHWANIDAPDHIDGRVWPFLGGSVRDKAFSESLFSDTYSAVIKKDGGCYHLSYPYDADNRAIDFKNRNPIISYKREDFFDIEEDIGMGEKEMLEIYDAIESMYLSSKKYY
jgi:hypothetical protein